MVNKYNIPITVDKDPYLHFEPIGSILIINRYLLRSINSFSQNDLSVTLTTPGRRTAVIVTSIFLEVLGIRFPILS